MRNRFIFRKSSALLASVALFALCAPVLLRSQDPAQVSSAEVLDRVVAVVNNHAILASDIQEEIRLSVLDPGRGGLGVLTPQTALEQLIGRSLIQQQMRQEDAEAADPTPEELATRLNELRTELPACVRQNCATDAGWKAFLAAHGLIEARVEAYVRFRVEILRFIEQRFRQGIRIPPQEVEAYYRITVLPQYSKGEEIPPLNKVSARIEEILLQQRVNVLFDDWLNNLRKQGDVEVLDPSLETPASVGTGSVAPSTPRPAIPAISQNQDEKETR
jgi:hypothetical protein